jgi:excinuclease ABC subunit C
VRRVNDWFQLRDCPKAQEMAFADQTELFPVVAGAGCLRHEIGTCLGPCVGACSQRAYAARVRQARAFLAGADPGPLQTLERDMTAAAAAQAFERAAGLRDRLQSLRWLHEQLARMRQVQAEGSLVYLVDGHDGTRLWYVIRGGRTVLGLHSPCDSQTRKVARDKLEEVYRAGRPEAAGPPFEHLDGLLLVAAWFRRYPAERARTLTPAEALALCRGRSNNGPG